MRINPSLPSRLLLLNRPQDRIRKQREYAGEVNTNIATIGPKFLRNGSNVPSLAHTRDTTGEVPDQESHHRGKAPGQLTRLVPSAEIVSFVSSEVFVFDEEDEGEADGPVSQQAHKVADDGREMVLARDGKNGNDERDEEGPDEARDGVEPVAQELEGEAAGVIDGDVVAQDGEHEEDEGELGPAIRVIDSFDQTAQTMILVCVIVWTVGCAYGSVPQTGTNDRREDCGDGHTEEGQSKHFP